MYTVFKYSNCCSNICKYILTVSWVNPLNNIAHSFVAIVLGTCSNDNESCDHKYEELSTLSEHLQSELDDMLPLLFQTKERLLLLEKRSERNNSSSIHYAVQLLHEIDKITDEQVRVTLR